MSDAPILRSRRPYLLRAMHEWISDNQQTPHIVVDASVTGVEVPRQYVQDGKIILNVSVNATSGLNLGNDGVVFRARFGPSTYDVSVPIAAVLGIYARETGQGMIFSEADAPPPQPPPAEAQSTGAPEQPKKGKPTLKVVK
ncbi:stringent starvation protein B [Povalibacter uvarum]|uniref:Stringent starvation protein B n=1 Tax=Povalibacter uvarum TaxID=732238 RepID=A0A841HTY6_9GAMM|nr:ClpXP protease specificity-enhancing factor [Povalibacter uvarum]MBB6095670.1 stringent starvation protein B [Povalibacter uvarum]